MNRDESRSGPPTGAIEKVTKVFEYGAWAALFTWVPLMTIGTLSRYLFNKPLNFQTELVAALLVVFSALSFGPVFANGSHIRVDLITRRLSKTTQSKLMVFADVLTFLFVVAMAIAAVPMIGDTMDRSSTFPVWGAPVAPFQIVMALGFAVFAIIAATGVVRRIRTLGRRNKETS